MDTNTVCYKNRINQSIHVLYRCCVYEYYQYRITIRYGLLEMCTGASTVLVVLV